MSKSEDSLEEGEILEEGELPSEATGPARPRTEPRLQQPPSYRDHRPPRRDKGLRPPPPLGGRGGWAHGRSPRGGRLSYPPEGRGPPPFSRHGPPLPPYKQPPPPPYERAGSRPPVPGPPPVPLPSVPLPPPRPASLPPPRALTADEQAARDAREMEGLAADVQSLARTLTLQECLKDLGRVCSDLRVALHKAITYLRLLKERNEVVMGADSSEAVAELGAKLLGGLRALHVYSNTGQGRSMGPDARGPVQAAWCVRDQLFTTAQRKQLEGFVSGSKNFAALLVERSPSPLPVRHDYVPAPRQQQQHKERKRRLADEEAEPEVEQPRISKRQLKRMQAQQRAEEAAAARAKQLAEQHAVQQAGQPAQAAEAPLPAEEKAEVVNNKQFKLTIKLGGTSLTGAAAPVPPKLAPSDDATLEAMPKDHWQWHEQQQQQQQQQPFGVPPPAGSPPTQQPQAEPPPPLPPEVPGGGDGWQSVAAPPPAPLEEWEGMGEPPLSPMSGTSSPWDTANGNAQPARLGLDPAAVEHAAAGSPAVQELLGRGKLCLVLDLDHTLLNSATFGEVGPALHEALKARAANEAATLPQDQRLLFRMDSIKMWTKLRPGVHSFLQRAARYYQLWIHTNGNRAYADSVVRLLDPLAVLFGDRIIAQGADRLDQMVPDQAKRLMQGLDEREAITVIVDDSHSVWAQHRHNLVAVERYVYFPSSRASLGLTGPSLLDANRDECPGQGMLMVALDVLVRVHGVVMRALCAPPQRLPGGEVVFQNWDVRHALAQERQKVLAGLHLVFTRVIPLEMEPASHALWRLAESYGATCSGALEAATTHVIAGASGTEKVLAARGMGKWVVTPAWLECSCILWKRAHEDRFLVPL